MKRIQINYKKLTYPSILTGLIILIMAAGFLTARFLTASINSSFDTNEAVLKAGMIKIDMTAYELTAKKLSIPYPANVTTTPSSTPPSAAEQAQQ